MYTLVSYYHMDRDQVTSIHTSHQGQTSSAPPSEHSRVFNSKRRWTANLEAFERATPQVDAITTTATHRTRARGASRRPEPDLPELSHDAGPSIGAVPRQVQRRSDITGGLNDAVEPSPRPRNTDLLMQGRSMTSHSELESHIPALANLDADSMHASGRMHAPLTTHHQCLNENSTPPSPTHEYIPPPPPVPFHSMTLPNKRYNPTPSDAGTDVGVQQRSRTTPCRSSEPESIPDFSLSTPCANYLTMLASNSNLEQTSIPEANPTAALPMFPDDEAAAQAIASALSASHENFNLSDFLTSPISPWDELLIIPALDADLGMTPDIYTSPLLQSFDEDFENLPSLFGDATYNDYNADATVSSSFSPFGLPPLELDIISPEIPALLLQASPLRTESSSVPDGSSVLPTVHGQSSPQVKRRPDITDEPDEAGNIPSRPEETDLPMQSLLDAPNDALQRDRTSPTPTQGHIPSSSSVPLRIKAPPDKLHPTLSSWIKNMNKLSDLIDRLHELASSAPESHRSQLSRQVVTLRETFKRQQERCIEFLQLNEEYASGYLLDISGEIQQQSSFLETLEKRLDMAIMMRGQAVALRKSHESGTVASMKDVRVTALPRPLPEDFDLFSEVDLVLAEIRRCYEELDKFWTDEIRRAVKALEMRRVDLRDFERWKNFHSSIKQANEYSKTRPPSCDTQPLRRKSAHSSTGEDIGSTVVSLLPAMDSLKGVLKRIRSSASFGRVSHLGTSLALRLELAYAENRDLFLGFLQRCVQYAEIMTCPPHISRRVSSHADSLHDLRECVMRSQFETTSISAESAVHARGSRNFKASYERPCVYNRRRLSG